MSSSPGPGRRIPGSAVGRCRSCGARLRPAETWCSLCHHSVLDAEPGGPGELAGSGERAEPAELNAAGRPDAAPEDERPTDPAVLAEADRLIAELAAAETERHRESRLGALQGRLGARSGGLILAVAGGAALLVIGILGLTLLGLML